MAIKHRFHSPAPDVGGPNTIKVSHWNDTEVAVGGAQGLTLVRDTAHPDGMEWLVLGPEGGGTGADSFPEARQNLSVYSIAEVDAIMAGLSYRHIQATAATVWDIVHNLSFRPNVMAVDSSGREMIPGYVDHVSAVAVRLTFSAEVGGEAYLS